MVAGSNHHFPTWTPVSGSGETESPGRSAWSPPRAAKPEICRSLPARELLSPRRGGPAAAQRQRVDIDDADRPEPATAGVAQDRPVTDPPGQDLLGGEPRVAVAERAHGHGRVDGSDVQHGRFRDAIGRTTGDPRGVRVSRHCRHLDVHHGAERERPRREQDPTGHPAVLPRRRLTATETARRSRARRQAVQPTATTRDPGRQRAASAGHRLARCRSEGPV